MNALLGFLRREPILPREGSSIQDVLDAIQKPGVIARATISGVGKVVVHAAHYYRALESTHDFYDMKDVLALQLTAGSHSQMYPVEVYK